MPADGARRTVHRQTIRIRLVEGALVVSHREGRAPLQMAAPGADRPDERGRVAARAAARRAPSAGGATGI